MAVRRAAALLACLLLLAGCAGKTAVGTLPVLSRTAVPVATAAGDATPAGAVAFAKHYFAQISQAFATADPGLVSSLSQPGCKTCARFIDSIRELRAQHERTTPVTFTIRFAAAPATDGRTARVDIQYDYGGSQLYNAAGRLISDEKPARGRTITVKLVRRGGSWRVAEIT